MCGRWDCRRSTVEAPTGDPPRTHAVISDRNLLQNSNNSRTRNG